jgi:hypothetical protein
MNLQTGWGSVACQEGLYCVGVVTAFVFASFYQIIQARMVLVQTVEAEDIKNWDTFDQQVAIEPYLEVVSLGHRI